MLGKEDGSLPSYFFLKESDSKTNFPLSKLFADTSLSQLEQLITENQYLEQLKIWLSLSQTVLVDAIDVIHVCVPFFRLGS